MDLKDLRVNGKRLQNTLEEMAKIGATPGGGVQRLTLTDEDKQARNLFVSWLNELDLDVTIDEMGNIFGKRPGKNNDLPPVMSAIRSSVSVSSSITIASRRTRQRAVFGANSRRTSRSA